MTTLPAPALDQHLVADRGVALEDGPVVGKAALDLMAGRRHPPLHEGHPHQAHPSRRMPTIDKRRPAMAAPITQ